MFHKWRGSGPRARNTLDYRQMRDGERSRMQRGFAEQQKSARAVCEWVPLVVVVDTGFDHGAPWCS